MDKAAQTMIENLHKNTGKSLEEWISIVQKQKIDKHGQIIKYLKENHGITHGFANLIALKARGADAGSVDNKDSLIENQYKGKEHFLPLYESIIEEVEKFGNDVEIAIKTTSVSLRRRKQFALLQPASKTRFEIGINLKGQEPEGRLEENTASNAMCSHKINVSVKGELDQEVLGWIRKAYDKAGP